MAGAAAAVTAELVKAEASAAGFDLCGIAPATRLPELGFLDEWLARGYAGEMHYLQRTAARRGDVREVLPSAQSVISLGVVYNAPRPYSVECADPATAAIARYAWGDDYHEIIGGRLERLLERLRQSADFEARAYVDTGPVQERVFARYAGLGWIGKNTCLINPELGSWIFLAAIICSLPLAPDAPVLDHCGTCTLCLEACPTGALVEPGVLDSTRCLSYLTIELKGAVPDAHRASIGAHAYGCDICQEVCPWNKFAKPHNESRFDPSQQFKSLTENDWKDLTEEVFQKVFKNSPLKRTKYEGLKRNMRFLE